MDESVEISIDRSTVNIAIGAGIVLLITGLLFLGKANTPEPSRLIGWGDWMGQKVEREYQEELTEIRTDLAEMIAMMQANPNPVEAEMLASRIEQHHAEGLGMLTYQREVVLVAAEAVRDWAAGYGTYENAVSVVNAAVQVLDETGDSYEYDVEHTSGDTTQSSASGSDGWWAQYQ